VEAPVTTRLRPPIAPALADGDVELVRREIERKLRELQQTPAASLVALGSYSLVDGVPLTIAHRLGREPVQVIVGPVRGPATVGMVEEVRTGGHDRRQAIVLKASGYGATVAADVAVL
jgi:hypothetical protein